MAETRPPIPSPMKRAVRQRCGFGCVKCGKPLYEYHHMTDYAIVLKHEEENITLLCDECHRDVTSGLLSDAQVRQANADPYSKRKGETAAKLLHFEGSSYKVFMSGGVFVDCMPGAIPLMVHDKPLLALRVEDSQLLISAQFFDARGSRILRIVDNELVTSSEAWDVEFVATRLTLRNGSRDITLVLDFHPPDQVAIDRATFELDGYQVHMDDGGTRVRYGAWTGKIPDNFMHVCNRGYYPAVKIGPGERVGVTAVPPADAVRLLASAGLQS